MVYKIKPKESFKDKLARFENSYGYCSNCKQILSIRVQQCVRCGMVHTRIKFPNHAIAEHALKNFKAGVNWI